MAAAALDEDQVVGFCCGRLGSASAFGPRFNVDDRTTAAGLAPTGSRPSGKMALKKAPTKSVSRSRRLIAARGLTLRFAQADSGSSAVLRNEFDARVFERFTQFHNGLLLRRQRARLCL
jgi:hypothetical protein